MALPVDRFVDPSQDFAGLYRYSGRLEQNRLRKEQDKQAAAGRKAASDKYFANYLDPKDRFTGTMADPEIAKQLGEALDEAFMLSSKGATDNEIFMAITPRVNRVNDYTQKVKQIQAQKKQASDVVGKIPGVDQIKFSSEFDDEVFMETDPKTGVKKMRDIGTIDPSQNYADIVLKNRDIYTPEGFDEYVAKAGKNTSLEDVSVYGKDKSMRRTKAEMTAPSFMISDKDERGAHVDFVPKYEIATDGENVVMGEFMGQDGKPTKAPVRMVTNDVFNDLPVSAKAYLRQEVRKLSKEKGVELNSAQAENLARALAYDELKNSGKQYSTLKEVQVQKAAPIIINNSGSGSSSKTPQQIDLTEYPDVEGGGKDITNLMQGIKVTGLPTGKTLLAEKVVFNPVTQKVTFKEYAERNAKGEIITGGAEKTMGLTTFLQNIKTNNPGTDMKFLEGLRNPITGAAPTPDKPKGKSWVVGDKTLTADQIKKGAAKYKMTEEQYLKSIGAKEQ